VQVTDASGKSVGGLGQEDFTLFDDGQAQKITSFRSANGSEPDAPIRVVLMVDTINNPSASIAHEHKELEKLLEQSQGRVAYPTAIALLSAAGAEIGTFSRDGSAVIGELRRVTKDVRTLSCVEEANAASQQALGGQASSVTPEGTDSIRTENLLNRIGNCENRRFQLSISALNKLAKSEAGVPGRTILVWIGPGWSLLTGPAFRPNTPAMRRSFFDYLADMSTSLREAHMTLDAVASPDMVRAAGMRREDYPLFLSRAPTGGEADAGHLSLPVLATQTGGRVLEDSKDIAGAVAACIADADAYYELSFDSPAAATAGEYRPLEVKVNKPGLSDRTRTAYFAQP